MARCSQTGYCDVSFYDHDGLSIGVFQAARHRTERMGLEIKGFFGHLIRSATVVTSLMILYLVIELIHAHGGR